jgi:hypothetical protein
MTQLDKVKIFQKCEKIMKSCTNSGQSLVARNYIDQAKKKCYITDKQYKYLIKL